MFSSISFWSVGSGAQAEMHSRMTAMAGMKSEEAKLEFGVDKVLMVVAILMPIGEEIKLLMRLLIVRAI